MSDNSETAILAGGCFWGMEDLVRKRPGVLKTDVGYAGGTLDNPTYDDVKKGTTGHAEALRVVFDPAVTSYEELLRFFFQIHDPTTVDRQGNDRGSQYRSAIFPQTDEQRRIAEETIAAIDASGVLPGKIVTRIEGDGPYHLAETYHQDYLERFPNGYTCHFVRPEWALKEDA
ncbi:MAG: peptide-methionine (S)-S-oxide reductase MsrA [Parvularculaceae bacterium]